LPKSRQKTADKQQRAVARPSTTERTWISLEGDEKPAKLSARDTHKEKIAKILEIRISIPIQRLKVKEENRQKPPGDYNRLKNFRELARLPFDGFTLLI